MRTFVLAAVTLLVLGACSGKQGDPGASGKSAAMKTTVEPAGANCATGGNQVQSGIDDNANGTLDAAEVDSTIYLCNGAAGATGQDVVPTLEAPGSNCPTGGVRLASGAGAPTFVCNGAAGAGGESVTVTPEPAGSHCTWGGQRLQVGSGTPSYVCDGAPGATGAPGQGVAMTPEPAGSNCAWGGQRLQVGSGTPAFVCDGAPGSDGAPGASVSVTPEPAGANCVFGGVALQVGTGPISFLCSGAPVGVVLPTVTTTGVSGVRYAEAVVSASVTSDGGEFILGRGVLLATHAGPTIHDTVIGSGAGAGAFTTRCDGLLPATTYYVRAFATNALGTAFGEELSFTTLALTVPTLTTQPASGTTRTTALSGGDITDDGGSPILGRGLCWSTAADPTLAASCASEGVGAGSFIAMATGLAPATSYHLRAYATNAQGTAYGQDRAFGTVVPPLATVTTAAASAVSYTSATGGGTVVSDAGSPVTSRGVCWSTSPAPVTGGTCASEAGGLGALTLSATGLAANTTYYLRAFAVNGGGTSYGNEVTFKTLAPAVPSLSTTSIGGISSNLAGSGGVITSDGGLAITAKGVCWSLNPTPTIANTKTNDGAGSASFNSTLTGLVPLSTYYVRAWASNALGTAYGNEVSFTTTDLVTPGPSVPIVGTTTPTLTSGSTASSGGYVSGDGGSPITARGICWSTSPNPALGGACASAGGGGLGYFASTVTGLSGCGVVYYVRAYATNSTGTAYGNQSTVSTGLLPAVTTSPVTAIGYYAATSGGSVTDDGGCAITQKGVAWSWNPDPTTANPKTADGAGSAAFSSSITGLYANRTYYVRAYATNVKGTTYGQQEVFVTATPATPYIGQNYAGGQVFYVDGTGLHGLVVGDLLPGYFTWGCPGTLVGTSTALGTGATNTAAIVATCADAGTGARAVDTLLLAGYSDWFVPSMNELSLVYGNLASKGLGAFNMGTYYMTSSEVDASTGFFVAFWSGAGLSSGKGGNYPVYPVRAF